MDDGFDSELLGRTLGGTYRVEERLGSGGMGAVFRATHLRTSRSYAIKVLLPEMAVRRDAMQRFRREAGAVGALGHANVVAVHDFDVTDGWAYLVMDLLDGEDLSARIERCGRLSLAASIGVLEDVAAGLGAAHRRGLLHRDLKPANIFLARQPGAPERAVLLDFGLAKSLLGDGDLSKLTATGVVMGTPQYMSPEQASGLPLDERADLYALATIFYEMLAGRVPFSAPTIPALFAKLATDPAPPLDVHRRDLPAALVTVLARALAKSPDERYPDAAHLTAALRAAAAMPAPSLQDVASVTAPQEPLPTPIGNAAASWPRGVDPHGATQATPSHVPQAAPPQGLDTPIGQPVAGRRWWPLFLVVVAGGLGFGLLAVGSGVYLYWLQVQQTRDQIAAVERSLPRNQAPAQPPTPLQAPPPNPFVPEPPPTEPPPAEQPPTEPLEVMPPRRRRTTRANREATHRVAAPNDTSPVNPPPPATPTQAPMGPPAGVRETTEYMGRGDFAGCIRESHRHPRSVQLLGARMSCATHGDGAELRRTCAEIRRHYPRHAYNRACDSLLQAQGASQ